MIITRLNKLDQFQALKKGDLIIVRWGESPRQSKKIMTYEIPRVQHNCDEIICDLKKNIYFNYKMHLGLDTVGVCTSNAKEVYLIEGDAHEPK